MLLEITDISVSRGGQTVLSGCSFDIHGTEKIALIGANGAGKTTFLEVLAGIREPEINEKNPASGIHAARRLTIGMLSQLSPDRERTAEECMQESVLCRTSEEDEKERFSTEAECDRLFTGLGFSLKDKKKKLNAFSGGEQRKIALICQLLRKPDLLLLDEPSNHLDLESTEWLEQYLKQYPKAVVVVSHDRFFLDQVAEAVAEIEEGKITRYAGNYTAFKKAKQEIRRQQKKAYEQQQEEIRRLNDLIERFRNKPRKAAFARSRKKILERMERIEKPREEPPSLRGELAEPEKRSSKWVWECEDLQIGYETPLQHLDLRLRRGQKLGILGANGTGKSTLLKVMAGELAPLAGKQHWGNGVEMAYFGQHAAELTSAQVLLDWFREKYPSLTEQEARRTLAGYLFTWQDMATPVSSLSGGEKARLQLAVLFGRRPNLLVLDEPTNHMDIPSKEAIEQILSGYQGTLVVVSHDRYFLNQTTQSLLIFRKDGRMPQYYPFGYSHYRERMARNQGKDSPGRELAEQAMIAGLRAVPRGSSLTGGHISEESIYRDWRFQGLLEELEEARKGMEEWEKSLWTEAWYEEPGEREKATRQEEKAREKWTKACLNWYDTWLEWNETEG